MKPLPPLCLCVSVCVCVSRARSVCVWLVLVWLCSRVVVLSVACWLRSLRSDLRFCERVSPAGETGPPLPLFQFHSNSPSLSHRCAASLFMRRSQNLHAAAQSRGATRPKRCSPPSLSLLAGVSHAKVPVRLSGGRQSIDWAFHKNPRPPHRRSSDRTTHARRNARGGHRQCDTERERAREKETYTETEAERGREGAGRLCDTGEFDQLAVPAPLPFFSV